MLAAFLQCAKLKKWENHRHLGSFAFERKERERITILVSRWKHVRKLRSLCGSLRKTVLASLTVPLPRCTRAELRGTPRCGKILPSSYALRSPLIPATRLNIFRVDSLEYSQNEGDLRADLSRDASIARTSGKSINRSILI